MSPPDREQVAWYTRRIAVVAGALALFLLLAIAYLTWHTVLLGLLGIGIGVVLVPVIDWLERHLPVPRAVATALFALFVVGVVAAGVYFLGGLLFEQLSAAVNSLPRAAANLERILPGWLAARANHALRSGDLIGTILGAGQALLSGLRASTYLVLGGVAVFFLAMYLAAESTRYFRGLVDAFPAHVRPRVAELAMGAACVLRRWFGAQIVSALLVGAMEGIGLWLVGVPYWILLGILGALTDLVPYLGPIGAAVVGMLVTLATRPESVPWVALVYLVAQQLENHVVVPLVMREGVELPPVPLVLFLLGASECLGWMGALIAAPAFAVLHYLYLHVYVPRTDSWREPATPRLVPAPASGET